VHHHFPTKATMTAAVARRYGDRFLAAVARRPNVSGDRVFGSLNAPTKKGYYFLSDFGRQNARSKPCG
jgi:TetR/AcrR family transcriptional repressor of nem operon